MTDILDKMTESASQPPMQVHPSPWPDQAAAFLRQIVPPIVAFAVGRGFLKNDTATLILALGAVIGPIVWGQIKTRLRAMQLSALAKEVDDSVAVVKK